MNRTHPVGVALAVPLLGGPLTPVDECRNADRGLGDAGPPGFVASLVPDVIGDLIGSLPVPTVVKVFFGAPTC